MNIYILDTLADAEKASGEIVVIDVFRSSNTVIELLHAGVKEILAVENLEDARLLGAKHPDWLLLGERGGRDVEGFHGGNSPAEMAMLAYGQHTAILTTSGGTRVMRACGEKRFWVGCFCNAGALARRLEGAQEVSLWAVGRAGKESAAEDVACAEFLAARLRGKNPDFAPIREKLLASPGAGRLRRWGRQADLERCLQVDRFGILPHRTATKEGWPCLTH